MRCIFAEVLALVDISEALSGKATSYLSSFYVMSSIRKRYTITIAN